MVCLLMLCKNMMMVCGLCLGEYLYVYKSLFVLCLWC